MTRLNRMWPGFARGLAMALAMPLIVAAAGCATRDRAAGTSDEQAAFPRPHGAARALASAARDPDNEQLKAVLGPGSHRLLTSGDAVADRRQREVFVTAMAQGWVVEAKPDGSRQLLVGDERWPFPVPLVRAGGRWRFDSEAGAREVVARRIGRNELAVIDALRVYAVAQRQYAAAGREGQPAGAYAQKVRSDPGRQNGLYWPATAGAQPSPLSEFVSQAAAEGYTAGPETRPAPYHGYLFRVLTRQGAHAKGGARDYVVDGRMAGGFAMVAHPAQYGASGVMSFIVGPDGVVHETDLGPETVKAVSAIDAFDPDPRWTPVK